MEGRIGARDLVVYLLRDPLMIFMKFMLQCIDIYIFGIFVFDNYAPNHRKMDRPGKANAVMTRLNSR